MLNSTTRFSDRVDNYVRFRPDYPAEIVTELASRCGIAVGATVADIGCGTGISSRVFIESGFRVVGIEPNENMRAAAVEYLSQIGNFAAVEGTAEQTTLGVASVDLVVAAQAFHWFDRSAARIEFCRILRPPGRVALIWNERVESDDAFHSGYDAIIRRYGRDVDVIRSHRMDETALLSFLGDGYEAFQTANSQSLDLDGLLGRTFSSSYMPNENEPDAVAVRDELAALFAKHERNGRIEILYNTNVYFSCNFLCQ